jgi:hypothetical protein
MWRRRSKIMIVKEAVQRNQLENERKVGFRDSLYIETDSSRW